MIARICHKLAGSRWRAWGQPKRPQPVGVVMPAWRFWLMFLFAVHLGLALAFAEVSREYQLKSVLLWRLAQFTEWPKDAFANPESPILICVLGEDPFGEALDAAAQGETAQGRKLVVQRTRSVDEAKMCHILFISASAARQVKRLTTALAGRSILTVTDADPAARSYEGMIQFMTEENKIKLLVNLKAVKAARLVLDSRLLRVAEIVGDA